MAAAVRQQRPHAHPQRVGATGAIDALVDAVGARRLRVTRHPLYEHFARTGLREDGLRTFMESHVWCVPPTCTSAERVIYRCAARSRTGVSDAPPVHDDACAHRCVYDYFQLLKRLQAELTCVRLPWRPTVDAPMRRFISEIVLEEECDVFEDGKTFGSHLELYLRAMEQARADTGPIRSWLALLDAHHDGGRSDPEWPGRGAALADLLVGAGAPSAAARHVTATMDLARYGSIAEVAAVFAFGREDVIPAMFSALLREDDDSWLASSSIFKYYLERHIELDGDDHGPLSMALVDRLCGADGEESWERAQAAVKEAFELRAGVWDEVHDSVRQRHYP